MKSLVRVGFKGKSLQRWTKDNRRSTIVSSLEQGSYELKRPWCDIPLGHIVLAMYQPVFVLNYPLPIWNLWFDFTGNWTGHLTDTGVYSQHCLLVTEGMITTFLCASILKSHITHLVADKQISQGQLLYIQYFQKPKKDYRYFNICSLLEVQLWEVHQDWNWNYMYMYSSMTLYQSN